MEDELKYKLFRPYKFIVSPTYYSKGDFKPYRKITHNRYNGRLYMLDIEGMWDSNASWLTTKLDYVKKIEGELNQIFPNFKTNYE